MANKLIRNTGLYTIGNIIPKAAQFLLLPLYTRYLTPEDYGIVQSMQVLSTILTIIFSLALERSIYRLYFDFKTESDKKDFLGSVYLTMMIVSSLLLVVILLGKSIASSIFSSIPFSPFYLYAILTVYLTVFSLIPKVYFQVEQKAGKFILISILQFALSTGFIIYFIVFDDGGAEGMLLGRLVASALLIPLFVIIITKIIHFKIKKQILKESLSFSWPLVFMLLAAWIINLSDRIFIERYSSLKEVGIYSVSYKLAEILLIFTTAFNKAYDPLFYKLANQKDQDLAKSTLFKYNRIYAIVLIIASLLIALFSKEFIYLLDNKYESAYKLVPLLVIGILFGQVGGLFNRSIYQVKKTKLITVLTVLSAILNIGLNFLLVPQKGALGAAIATLVTFFFFFFVRYYLSKKAYFIPFAWGSILPFFFAFIGIVGLFSFIELKLITGVIVKISVVLLMGSIVLFNNKNLIINLIKRKNQ